MNKNNKPYSENRNLRIAHTSSFDVFAFASGKFIGQIKSDAHWKHIPIVPGTLQVSCTPTETNTYAVEITFRVSFSEPENQNYILSFADVPVVARYTSAAVQEKIAGTKENFLKMKVASIAGFDGYECRLTGVQNTLELFV